MSIVARVKQSLSLKTSVLLAIPMIVITAIAAIYVTLHQTAMMEDITLEKARVAAKLGARFYGEKLEEAIDVGVLTVQDVFDTDYREIEGYDWGDMPKFHTRYDSYTDHAVIRFQDEFLENPDFVFAVGQDKNGYIPTHNTQFQPMLTGNPEEDGLKNRTKRVFKDEVGLKASEPRTGDNLILIQDYLRDTGEQMWDVSAPIYVKGKHWGAFRLDVSKVRVNERSKTLLALLGGVFLVFGVTAIGTILVGLNRAMQPVERLTAAADQISLGEGLDKQIKPETEDEIGRLARSIDRLRISMRAAMGRLGE